MDRSYLSQQDVIAASRPFICVRLTTYESKEEGAFLKANPHPRAYGNFARLLGRYVREEKIISLTEAIRRLSGLPAARTAKSLGETGRMSAWPDGK